MRIVVGVVRGGPGAEYDASLRTGASVLEHLNKDRYEARDIFIDRTGLWHMRGLPVEAERALSGVDVAFNALHGSGAEGSLQRTLASLKVPYTGPGALAAAQARRRSLNREIAVKTGAKVPYGVSVELDGDIERASRRLFRAFPLPLAVIIDDGQIRIADDYHALERALGLAAAQSPKVLVEEYIPGRTAHVGIVDSFRNEKIYALIPLPQSFDQSQKDELTRQAKALHEALDLAHYSTIAFTVTKRGIYFASADPLPELHDDSMMCEGLAGVGASMPHFLDHVIQLARNE